MFEIMNDFHQKLRLKPSIKIFKFVLTTINKYSLFLPYRSLKLSILDTNNKLIDCYLEIFDDLI